MEEIKFSMTMRVKDMYRFLLYHGYSGMSGIINMIISIGALVLLLAGVGDSTTAKVMLGIMAALFTIINPIYLYYKAAKQVKLAKMFAKPLNYQINEDGITVSQGEESLIVDWKDVRRLVETAGYFYLYLSLTRAYIFPKEILGEQEKNFRKILETRVNPKVCKWRKK